MSGGTPCGDVSFSILSSSFLLRYPRWRMWFNCGSCCYYKTSKSFKREPCFHTCVQLQNEKHVACRPGPVLQWSDRNMFEVQIVNKTRTGQPCVAENKEMLYSSRELERLYPSMRKASCWEAEANSYLGPMCYRNDSRKEACYYACEHRNLFCIDRDHMLNIEYNGPKNTTIHGLPCMQWVDVIALVKRDLFNYQWKWIFQDGDASAIAEIFSEPTDHNQCLNILTLLKVQSNYYEFPGIDPVILKGPICFVNVQDFIVPQPCFMTCEDMSIEENNCIEKESIRTAIYTGFRNRSKTGKPCRRWDEKIFDFNVPWEITGPLHNYCRNYGNYEHGPWCYVLRGGVEREQCFDVCPESKTIISYKESDHNWQYDPCTEHSECCEGKDDDTDQPTDNEDNPEILSQLDKIWPDPSKEIRDIMLRKDEDEEEENKWIMYFGIYAVSHLFICICWLWWIHRGPDPEKERENLEVEEEKEHLKEVAESLAKKAKKPRRRRTASSSESGKSKSRDWLSGFRRSRQSIPAPSQNVDQTNF